MLVRRRAELSNIMDAKRKSIEADQEQKLQRREAFVSQRSSPNHRGHEIRHQLAEQQIRDTEERQRKLEQDMAAKAQRRQSALCERISKASTQVSKVRAKLDSVRQRQACGLEVLQQRLAHDVASKSERHSAVLEARRRKAANEVAKGKVIEAQGQRVVEVDTKRRKLAADLDTKAAKRSEALLELQARAGRHAAKARARAEVIAGKRAGALAALERRLALGLTATEA